MDLAEILGYQEIKKYESWIVTEKSLWKENHLASSLWEEKGIKPYMMLIFNKKDNFKVENDNDLLIAEKACPMPMSMPFSMPIL